MEGRKADKTFNAIRARIATIAFAYNIGNLPEMQVLHCLNCEIVKCVEEHSEEYLSMWECLLRLNVGQIPARSTHFGTAVATFW